MGNFYTFERSMGFFERPLFIIYGLFWRSSAQLFGLETVIFQITSVRMLCTGPDFILSCFFCFRTWKSDVL